jgi:hypothetical protein
MFFRLLTIATTCLALFASCNKQHHTKPQPDGKCGNTCILEKTQSFEYNSLTCDTGASIKQYSFQGQNVYVFDYGYCLADGTAAVLNEHCDTLGFLGGIAGNGIINNVNFYEVAQYQLTIWSN